ncbi:MAG: GNAT family N-acetyltransferase [Anaerolineales bacterium]|nr:GNAT family N-acetyltransferase [Anaerolineales bacterium]
MGAKTAITLRPYGDGDFELLRATLGVPEMTQFLGGPESPEKLSQRHQRYVALQEKGENRMFVILAGAEQQAVGTIGYWEHEYEGEPAWETGWAVLPAWQGHGLASQATREVIARLRTEGSRRYLFAYPTVENLASNGVCRKAGFKLLGPEPGEYPKGNKITFNVWRYDLAASSD